MVTVQHVRDAEDKVATYRKEKTNLEKRLIQQDARINAAIQAVKVARRDYLLCHGTGCPGRNAQPNNQHQVHPPQHQQENGIFEH
eukprot:g19114.t1